jgi:hypothetical protein
MLKYVVKHVNFILTDFQLFINLSDVVLRIFSG